MSDIDTLPNGASMYGSIGGPVGARIEARVEDAHLLRFRESEIPQNIMFDDVVKVEFDDEGCFLVETTTHKFNIIFNWVEDPEDEDLSESMEGNL